MEPEIMEAVRVLADFAESHGPEVYDGSEAGDEKTEKEWSENLEHLQEAARVALAYLDGEDS